MVYAVNAIVVIGTVAVHLCLDLKANYKSAVNYSVAVDASFVLTTFEGVACLRVLKSIGDRQQDTYVYDREVVLQAVKPERFMYLSQFLLHNEPIMFTESDFEDSNLQLSDLVAAYGTGSELVLDAILIE